MEAGTTSSGGYEGQSLYSALAAVTRHAPFDVNPSLSTYKHHNISQFFVDFTRDTTFSVKFFYWLWVFVKPTVANSNSLGKRDNIVNNAALTQQQIIYGTLKINVLHNRELIHHGTVNRINK